MSWSSESTDSSHRCCNENTHKISSPGHSQWYGSKCCSAEFEESYSEYATLFWLIFPVSSQEHWFWSKSSHFFLFFQYSAMPFYFKTTIKTSFNCSKIHIWEQTSKVPARQQGSPTHSWEVMMGAFLRVRVNWTFRESSNLHNTRFQIVLNSPFYSCVLGCQAFEQE